MKPLPHRISSQTYPTNPRVTVLGYSSGMVEEMGHQELTGGMPDWSAIRRDYEDGKGTIADLCDRHHIAEWQFRYRREREKWRLRKSRRVDVGGLIGRLLGVLDTQLAALEKTEMPEPIDKQAALLGTMAKTLEKLMELESAEQARKPQEKKEMSELRNKLAERIAKLRND